MDTLFLVGLAILGVFLFLVILRKAFSWSARMNTLRQYIERYFGWNVVIRYILEAYIEVLLVSFIRIKYMRWDAIPEGFLTVVAYIMGTALIGFFFFSSMILWTYYEKIEERWFVRTYGELTIGLRNDSRGQVIFFPIFMVRRFVLVFVIIAFPDMNYF